MPPLLWPLLGTLGIGAALWRIRRLPTVAEQVRPGDLVFVSTALLTPGSLPQAIAMDRPIVLQVAVTAADRSGVTGNITGYSYPDGVATTENRGTLPAGPIHLDRSLIMNATRDGHVLEGRQNS